MDAKCLVCGVTSFMELQFKYGFVRGLEYRAGDTVLWSGLELDTPGRKKVRVSAIDGPCPSCHTDYLEFDLVLENDRIIETRPATDEVELAQSDGVVDED